MQTTPKNFNEVVKFVIDFINILITVLFALLFLFVVYKIIDAWVINGGDEKKVEEGKKQVTVAVIVFVVMVSTWGIVSLIKNSLFG